MGGGALALLVLSSQSVSLYLRRCCRVQTVINLKNMRPVLATAALIGILAGLWYLVRSSQLADADQVALRRSIFLRTGAFAPAVALPVAPVDARCKVPTAPPPPPAPPAPSKRLLAWSCLC
jgi:hypothetical protein